jgi:plastocyanin
MDRRRFLGAGMGALVATAGCMEASCGPHEEFDVGMASNSFCPETLRVSPGETVEWRNTGSRPHTVTAYQTGFPDGAAYFASGGFESPEAARSAWNDAPGDWGAIRRGETFSHQFEVPGTYEYFCVPHERGGMVGTVLVEPATPAPQHESSTTESGATPTATRR